MLNVSNYSVAYGQSEILRNLNLTVGKAEIVAVMGRNGMGKTTLMNSLIGTIPSRAGNIVLDGKDVSGLKSHDRVKAGFGFVPQGRMIFSTMTVRENIETGLVSTGRRSVPQDIYDLFPVLLDMRNRRGGNLSGGQQQQLAIARALASNPKLLLLDEPTEGIQPSIISEMARTLKLIRDQRGLSIIVSEQVLKFALDIADRILVIEKGEIVHEELRESVDEAKVASYLAV
ncbi:urea ABC transporter ATP-binding subunit UrtE [Marinimicrobium alkaliphilum]|uniref:urea ABC transporter ATP-binding subunit UrtE n=1 Tax=Marinimicrobium alkaliphilum TaxID=2202654 RepID=UPI000DB8FC3D|nr:urea ABC transporter ATP-binding subunit UrtE [Marinimicrobium alkaliphilum]